MTQERADGVATFMERGRWLLIPVVMSELCPSPALGLGHQLHCIIIRMNEGTSVWVVVLSMCPGRKLGPMGGVGELIKDDSWISGLRKWVESQK